MNSTMLVARLFERPGALERFFGTIRRRALPVEGASIARCGDGQLEVVVLHESRDIDRTLAELSLLRDLVDVSRVPAERSVEARELVVARVRQGGEWPSVGYRILEEGSTETVVEVTGTSSEIDSALAFWSDQGVLAGSVRTGEILFPAASSSRKVEQDQ